MTDIPRAANEYERYSRFDPFNHGVTTIRLKEVSPEVSFRLNGILTRAWGIGEGVEQIDEGVKPSNNFRVVTDSGVYLLKESHIESAQTQLIVARCLQYCTDAGIATPRLVPTNSGALYFEDQRLYCLFDYIDGEHFDGSVEELASVAKELGRLHLALAELSFADEVRRHKGALIHHEKDELLGLLARVRTDVHSDISLPSDETLRVIDEQSKKVSESGIARLPLQVIHYDLHPHNVLFDKGTDDLLAIIDFDFMLFSQRARDVAFAMHRFARTYGPLTERQNDIGGNVRARAQKFLSAYQAIAGLEEAELESITALIEDESLVRIMIIMREYFSGNRSSLYDLEKQIVTLREADLFR